MAARITVEFDLPADEIPVILGLRNARVRGGIYVAFTLGLGVLLIALGAAGRSPAGTGGGLFFLAIGLFAAWAVFKGPSGEKHALRLAGPTKVEFSADGVHYAGRSITERFEWKQVMFLNEKQAAWVLSMRPSGTCIVPKAAVDPQQRDAFVRQVMEWAGKRHRPCNR